MLFSSVAFIFFATYLVLVPSQESSFDKYVWYFSAILVKYMEWNEMKWNVNCKKTKSQLTRNNERTTCTHTVEEPDPATEKFGKKKIRTCGKCCTKETKSTKHQKKNSFSSQTSLLLPQKKYKKMFFWVYLSFPFHCTKTKNKKNNKKHDRHTHTHTLSFVFLWHTHTHTRTHAHTHTH